MKALVWPPHDETDLGANLRHRDIPDDSRRSGPGVPRTAHGLQFRLTTKPHGEVPRGRRHRLDELKSSIRHGAITGEIVPVLMGTAFKNKGVQPLLDAVVDYMPSPLDIPEIKGTNPRNEEESDPSP